MPLEVSPPAEGRELEVAVFFERSRWRGRCREVGRSGDAPGSFFTMILGGTPFRDLRASCQLGALAREATMPVEEYEVHTSLESPCRPRGPWGCCSGVASPQRWGSARRQEHHELGREASWTLLNEGYRHMMSDRGVRATGPRRWLHSCWARSPGSAPRWKGDYDIGSEGDATTLGGRTGQQASRANCCRCQSRGESSR